MSNASLSMATLNVSVIQHRLQLLRTRYRLSGVQQKHQQALGCVLMISAPPWMAPLRFLSLNGGQWGDPMR